MIDLAKLHALLADIGAGGTGMAALYGDYLDRLPGSFGSRKLAGEADLVLAALASAELAAAAAARAVAPTGFVEDAVAGKFRRIALAPVEATSSDWRGVPLLALASVLDRTREAQGVDDESYAASFIYVLFRLKAALGVWRGDTTPDSRYRLWLKDLAPVIAAHPRMGPLVQACHARIARAVFETSASYGPQLEAAADVAEPPVFAGFASTAQHHAALAGLETGESLVQLGTTLRLAGVAAYRQHDLSRAIARFTAQIALLGMAATGSPASCNELAEAYNNRGNARRWAEGHGPGPAMADFDVAIAIRDALRQALEPAGAWPVELRNDLARAYMGRGIVKESAEGHGPGAALGDYDAAIAIRETVRAVAEPKGEWHDELRSGLARAYGNRGNAKRLAEGYGPGAALDDYDAAIRLMEARWTETSETGHWHQTDFASAYMNRGNAKQLADGHGPGAALGDYDAAIGILEGLRRTLEPQRQWHPELRNNLARAYTNRGVAKGSAAAHGPNAAIPDFDAAVLIREALRQALEPQGQWHLELRNDLANAYINRGNARRDAAGIGPSAALGDYDTAIRIGEALRQGLERDGQWHPGLRYTLAEAYLERGRALAARGDHAGARHDADVAHGILGELVAVSADWQLLLEAASGLAAQAEGMAR